MEMKYKAEIVAVKLPERREVKPTGKIYVLGEYLTVKQTSNYLKSTRNENN